MEPAAAFCPPFPLYKSFGACSSRGVAALATFSEGMASVMELIRHKKRVVVIVGAGISTSAGIPDFRSKDKGIYNSLDISELGLDSPEELFDMDFFQENPEPFFKFAKHLYFPLGQKAVQPSDTHKFLSLLDQRGMLLRVYSQNIDGLEEVAGVSPKKIVYAHGSLQKATCLRCKKDHTAQDMEEHIVAGTVPRCRAKKPSTTSSVPVARSVHAAHTRSCKRPKRNIEHMYCNGVLKPSITFFGESLGTRVSKMLELDRQNVDALLVIGTSLSVAPISKVIEYFPATIPRILINQMIVKPAFDAADTNHHHQERLGYTFDAYLLGFCDDIARLMVKYLFQSHEPNADDDACIDEGEGEILSRISESQVHNAKDWEHVSVPQERVFLFPGALPHRLHDSGPYDEIAHCDGCGNEIKSTTVRKCTVCFDFDLCTRCYPRRSREHFSGKHKFTTEKLSKSKQS